jgi:UDP-glucose 4-epimerase
LRDYIHVVDVAEAHVAAVQKAMSGDGSHVFNLGTGQGHSVLEVVKAFEAVTGISVPRRIASRRPGDVEKIWSSCDLANRELHWKATRSLTEIVESAWKWQQTLGGNLVQEK